MGFRSRRSPDREDRSLLEELPSCRRVDRTQEGHRSRRAVHQEEDPNREDLREDPAEAHRNHRGEHPGAGRSRRHQEVRHIHRRRLAVDHNHRRREAVHRIHRTLAVLP